MTQNEFALWIRWHGARFPQWASWLAGADQRSAQSPGMPTGSEVTAAMYDVLADVQIADAKLASTALAKGDEPPPKLFEDHPAVVRAVSRRRADVRIRLEPKARYANGEPTCRCQRCRDAGVLTIWHPTTMQVARKTPELLLEKRAFPYQAAVACNCEKGCRRKQSGLEQIQPWMIVLEDNLNHGAKLAELIEHMAAIGGETKVYDFTFT